MEGDAGSTKYAPLGQIDADNIEQLQVVWQWTNSDTAVLTSNELGVGAFKATPIMVHGVLYVRTSLIGSGATPGGTSGWQGRDDGHGSPPVRNHERVTGTNPSEDLRGPNLEGGDWDASHMTSMIIMN